MGLKGGGSSVAGEMCVGKVGGVVGDVGVPELNKEILGKVPGGGASGSVRPKSSFFHLFSLSCFLTF